jgi:hypothetical protein
MHERHDHEHAEAPEEGRDKKFDAEIRGRFDHGCRFLLYLTLAQAPRGWHASFDQDQLPASSEADGIDESDQRLPNSQRRPRTGRFH